MILEFINMQLPNILEIFQFQFMQRALIGGIFIGSLLAFLGVFVTLKRMSFFGDGIAHASLAGIAIGILISLNPLFTALAFSILIALLMYYLERKSPLASDAIIGIFFTTSMALGVLLISLKSGYQPDLMTFLFGNILSINSEELLFMIIMALLVVIFLSLNYKNLTLLVFDRESAYVSGVKVKILEPLLYISLSISVVLGVKILGIILASALLVIPASTAKLISKSFLSLIVNSILFSQVTVAVGLILSYFINTPSGATIILTGTTILLLIFGLSKLSK